MALTIPSTSSVTEAMISDWQSRFNRDRDRAITELLDIEDARVELPDVIVGNSTYTALVTRYYASLEKLPSNHRSRPLGRAAIALGSIAAGAIAIIGLILGSGGTPISGYSHVTSTINPDNITGYSATSVSISVQADTDDSVFISRIPDGWKSGVTSSSIMLAADLSASGTIRLTFQSVTSAAVNLQSDVIGFDIWRH